MSEITKCPNCKSKKFYLNAYVKELFEWNEKFYTWIKIEGQYIGNNNYYECFDCKNKYDMDRNLLHKKEGDD